MNDEAARQGRPAKTDSDAADDSTARREIHWGIAIEGACDFFFGRPIDANPYARDFGNTWESWRRGWLDASFFNDIRGDEERDRWQLPEAA